MKHMFNLQNPSEMFFKAITLYEWNFITLNEVNMILLICKPTSIKLELPEKGTSIQIKPDFLLKHLFSEDWLELLDY